ncbi:hypothetical protein LX92_02370 [Maribacter polysiphoniae]|uniref:Uncharacterized protein n=1 Tax=Maribacter polysiphoniae TaxID=429344 RepID=A0A316E521_9FLAO|nr:hypothetical protein LX92_02370 [Maribacter polysiphoniae]
MACVEYSGTLAMLMPDFWAWSTSLLLKAAERNTIKRIPKSYNLSKTDAEASSSVKIEMVTQSFPNSTVSTAR